MSDLISRSEVIDLLYKTFDEYRISTDKTSKLEGFGSEVFKRVREMPTAYDIDKVVEELEELAESHRQAGFDVEKNGFSNVADKMYGKQCAFMQAIEIVKQGGVSDDVCEWKYTKEIMDNAEFKVLVAIKTL